MSFMQPFQILFTQNIATSFKYRNANKFNKYRNFIHATYEYFFFATDPGDDERQPDPDLRPARPQPVVQVQGVHQPEQPDQGRVQVRYQANSYSLLELVLVVGLSEGHLLV